MLKYTAYTI